MPSSTPSSFAMLREIYEQPAAIASTVQHYLPAEGDVDAALLRAVDLLQARDRLVIAASGSSRHAGLAGEIMLEDLSGLPVDVEYASEYIYRAAPSMSRPAVLVTSQSGETGDTLAALREAGRRGLPSIAITNNAGSTMAREAEVSLPTIAGKEAAIPATKSFTTQLALLYCLALQLAETRGVLQIDAVRQHRASLHRIPGQLEAALPGWQQAIEALAPTLEQARAFLYLGRGVEYAIAREGALKLKESAYLNAEGYPAGEFRHGPSALLNKDAVLLLLATVDPEDPYSATRYEKTLQLASDLAQQGARILSLVTEGRDELDAISEACLTIPATSNLLAPLLEVVPLQLLAFTLAVRRGIDVDRPRNLVKSVAQD